MAIRYILLFTILFCLLIVYIQLAKHFNIVDKPNYRSSHSKITVLGGGIIFPVGALIWFSFFGFQYPIFFIGLTIISTISLVDDIIRLTSTLRLLIQFGAMLLLFSELGLQTLPWWNWIIIWILSTGIINAFNFMDGINGITAGYSISVISGLWLVNSYRSHFISNEFLYYIAVSIAVFSLFNFRKKAICFAGDVGSISIAFIVVFLMAKLIIQTGNPIYILFLSVYGVDSILTIIYRIGHNENIFKAHRKHLYQLLANELKMPHLRIAAIYSVLQFIICIIILLTTRHHSISILLSIFIIGFLILNFIVIRIKITKKSEVKKNLLSNLS